MSNNELELSRHEQAQSLHQQVMTSGALAAENLFNMAKALKDIRDGKFYKELGYQNFESYCEEKAGMKRRNAYNYISIVEKLDLENVQPVAHFGIKKLALLAKLSDEEQKQVVESVGTDNPTFKQLQEEINKLKGEKMLIENEREKLTAKLDAEAAKAEETRKKLIEESDINEGLRQELEESDKRLIDSRDEYIKLADENIKLAKENKELRERPVDVAVVDNSDSERRLQETIRSLERENIRQNELMDQRYAEDRRELEEQKQREIDAIRAEYEEKLRAAQTQTSEPDKEKQEFKILLVMAHDAVNRLVSFANSHGKRIYTEKAGDLLAASAAALRE